MSKKLVTSAQVESLRMVANAKGVSREQFQVWLDQHVGKTLDDIKNGTVGIVPPEGTRIYTVRIKYRPDREWQEAVNAAGPNTPSDYNVWKVGDQYPSTGTKEIEEDIIMLNYPTGGSWEKAQAWASGTKLKNTVPRQVFAIGEQYPNLHDKLGLNLMYVVATTECSFDGNRQACYVWWRGSARSTNLGWVSSFDNWYGWFAFRK